MFETEVKLIDDQMTPGHKMAVDALQRCSSCKCALLPATRRTLPGRFDWQRQVYGKQTAREMCASTLVRHVSLPPATLSMGMRIMRGRHTAGPCQDGLATAGKAARRGTSAAVAKLSITFSSERCRGRASVYPE